MEGWPVWLASISLRDEKGELVCTDKWKDSVRINGRRWKPSDVLRNVIGSWNGQDDHERCFRMNMTMCLHRKAKPEEVEKLSAWWHKSAPGMAGGPVEVLWSTVKQMPSALPCIAPVHMLVFPKRPDLWVPGDCGQCEPCQARAEVARR